LGTFTVAPSSGCTPACDLTSVCMLVVGPMVLSQETCSS